MTVSDRFCSIARAGCNGLTSKRRVIPLQGRQRPSILRRSCLTAVVAVFTAQALAAQIAAAPKGDSILLARDLDGDGHPDYAVLEFRRLLSPVRLETRVAVYLDGEPATRRPSWATAWAADDEGEYRLEKSIALANGASLLDIAFYGGDADQRTIVVVRRGRARVEIEHQVDYGQGSLTVGGRGAGIFIDASVQHLVLRGVELSSKTPCGLSQRAMIRLRYDGAQQRFVPDRRSCITLR